MSGDLALLRASRIDLSGAGVCPREDREVLVRGLFGEETGRARIVHRSRQRAVDVGELVEVVTPHASRREAPCPNHESRRGRCSGCALMELGEEAQRAQKRQMLTALGLEATVVGAGPPLGYRWSSKRVAFARAGSLALGSWVRGTHRGASMTGCLVDHPLIAAAADEVEREANALRLRPYFEKSGRGDLRYVWLKTDGVRVVTTLIAAAEDSPVRQLATRLACSSGVAFSVQESSGNAIRGRAAETLSGEVALAPRIADVEVPAGPLGFLQPNPAAIAEAYRALLADEDGVALSGERVLDLYAGAGVTTAILKTRFADVVSAESYPESAASLGVPPVGVLELLRQPDLPPPEVIIANPPRKGLGPEVTDALTAVAAPRVHVMSCGPEGLRRDLDTLAAGGYALRSLVAFDTLPQTPHVELVAKLVRL